MASESKKPSHKAFVVREGEDKGYWMEIGAAWAHKDGKGFDLQLDALPVSGRIALRVNEPKPKADK